MTDTIAKTARDPRAAIAWATKDYILVEYPVTGGGPPYIVRYRKTIEGLTAALNILIENPVPVPGEIQRDHPAIKRVSAVKINVSDDVRLAAEDIVRKLLK